MTAGLLLGACAGVEEASPVATPAVPASSLAGQSDTVPVAAPTPEVKTRHYTVVAGDTLWGIAKRFLDDPWRWRELWLDNPAIRNPHRIYPGDEIEFIVDGNGDAHITLARRALPVVKLSPQVRVEPLPPEPVPTVNKVVLDRFLTKARVVDKKDLKQAPYILGSAERHLLGGATPDEVYAMGLANDGRVDYSIYKRGATYRNQDGDILGYELVQVADARLLRYGKPSLLRLVQTSFGVKPGDYVLPRHSEGEYQFLPQPAPAAAQGHILSVFGGIRMIGQYDSVAIDLGHADGIAPGQVFAVLQPRDARRDPRSGKRVQGYDRRAGLLMVYQSYEHISHAVVMEARVPLRVHDLVAAP
jgi:hypothetical protein